MKRRLHGSSSAYPPRDVAQGEVVAIAADVLPILGGFNGRIAHVDLTSREVRYDEHDPSWYRRYGGGGGLAAWYLLHHIPAGADALGPANVIVFASSIVAGADAPGIARHAVLAKSPLSGVTGETQSASPFGPALKRSGLDALVVHGRSETPAYIVLGDGRAAVKDASAIWGLETADAHDRLIDAEGPVAHTALIGPAGENLVRFASIVNDVRFMSCRTGMGAVMGSKRLKGVVAVQGPDVAFGDAPTAREAIDDYWRNRRSSLFNLLQEDAGSMNWVTAPPEGGEVEGLGEREAMAGLPMPTRNWQKAVFTGVRSVANDVLEARYRVTEEPPPNIEHHRRYHVPAGEFATDERYGGAETESLTGVAVFTELTEPEPVLKAIEMTYRYGLDPESLGGTIAFAMESVEKGALGPADFDGIDVAFGDARAFLSLTEAIAHRRGVGDILAEGSLRAARAFGRGTEPFAMVTRGIEMSGHDPRNKPGWGLANASGPLGPDFMATEHDWDLSDAVEGSGVEEAIVRSRAYGILERVPEAEKGRPQGPPDRLSPALVERRHRMPPLRLPQHRADALHATRTTRAARPRNHRVGCLAPRDHRDGRAARDSPPGVQSATRLDAGRRAFPRPDPRGAHRCRAVQRGQPDPARAARHAGPLLRDAWLG